MPSDRRTNRSMLVCTPLATPNRGVQHHREVRRGDFLPSGRIRLRAARGRPRSAAVLPAGCGAVPELLLAEDLPRPGRRATHLLSARHAYQPLQAGAQLGPMARGPDAAHGRAGRAVGRAGGVRGHVPLLGAAGCRARRRHHQREERQGAVRGAGGAGPGGGHQGARRGAGAQGAGVPGDGRARRGGPLLLHSNPGGSS
eukprot:88124-Prorocentrum_minimum.AAC.1